MVKKTITIGVLALQGAFEKHRELLSHFNVTVRLIRRAEELVNINGLIIPGGESTTIGKLMDRFHLLEILQDKIKAGLPVFGTCAGTILLARTIEGKAPFKLGVLDIAVKRNAYGRQVDSFEADIIFPSLTKEKIRCIFIRAPIITHTHKDVTILGSYENNPVLVQQKNILAATFHPELTKDTTIHNYFLKFFF
jgi:5'-phosphate synthase pdxT subunit